MKPAIKIKNLNVNYGEHDILEKVSLEIASGDLVYLIGANGTGKTTFIKALLGLIPSSGEILINTKTNNQDIVSSEIAYVPQYSDVVRDFPITVKELLDLENKELSGNKISKMLGVDKLNNNLLSELSGGQLQRILIARSLLDDSSIYIFDEPFNNLDHEGQHLCADLIEDLHHQGKTVLVVSHDQSLIRHKQDKVLYFINRTIFLTEANDIIEHFQHEHK